MTADLLFVALAVVALQEPPATPIEEANEVAAVIVTARRGKGAAPKPEPFTYYRDHCFEANRLNGRSKPPADDSAWTPLDDLTRQKLKISDPKTAAYELYDSGRQLALVLKLEERPLPKQWYEHRCTLFIVGVTDQGKLVKQMTALFNGRGTQEHVGHPSSNYRKIPGWEQWLWQAFPPRNSENWVAFKSNSRSPSPSGNFVRLTAPFYAYRAVSFVTGEVVYSEKAARPTSVLTLTLTFRP